MELNDLKNSALGKIGENNNSPTWNNAAWPGGGLSLKTSLKYWVIGRESDNAAINLVDDSLLSWNGTAATMAGHVTRALSFNGSNHVYGPTGLQVEPTGGLTIATWIRPTGTVSVDQFVFGMNADYTANQRTLFGGLQTTRVFRWLRSIDGTQTWIITNGPSTLAADTWALLVCVYSPEGYQNSFLLPTSGNTLRGISVTTNPGQFHYIHANTRLAIAAFQHDYTGDRFVGGIDSFAVWNRPLSPMEIQTLWNNGVGLLYSEL